MNNPVLVRYRTSERVARELNDNLPALSLIPWHWSDFEQYPTREAAEADIETWEREFPGTWDFEIVDPEVRVDG